MAIKRKFTKNTTTTETSEETHSEDPFFGQPTGVTSFIADKTGEPDQIEPDTEEPTTTKTVTFGRTPADIFHEYKNEQRIVLLVIFIVAAAFGPENSEQFIYFIYTALVLSCIWLLHDLIEKIFSKLNKYFILAALTVIGVFLWYSEPIKSLLKYVASICSK